MSVNHPKLPESYKARLVPEKSEDPKAVPDWGRYVKNNFSESYPERKRDPLHSEHGGYQVHGEHIEHRETMGEHLRSMENMDNWSKYLAIWFGENESRNLNHTFLAHVSIMIAFGIVAVFLSKLSMYCFYKIKKGNYYNKKQFLLSKQNKSFSMYDEYLIAT